MLLHAFEPNDLTLNKAPSLAWSAVKALVSTFLDGLCIQAGLLTSHLKGQGEPSSDPTVTCDHEDQADPLCCGLPQDTGTQALVKRFVRMSDEQQGAYISRLQVIQRNAQMQMVCGTTSTAEAAHCAGHATLSVGLGTNTLCQQGQQYSGTALSELQQHSPTHVPMQSPRKRQRMSEADPEEQLSAQPGQFPQFSDADRSRQNTPADGGTC